MILVDSSIWIDHLRKEEAYLHNLLTKDKVLCHPFVIGEIAVGSIKDRDVVLKSMHQLTQAIVAHDNEVLQFISDQRLFGLGVSYVDVHLLAAVQMTPGTLLWTRDKRLLAAAARLQLVFEQPS